MRRQFIFLMCIIFIPIIILCGRTTITTNTWISNEVSLDVIPVESLLEPPAGKLKIPMMSYVYNSIYNVKNNREYDNRPEIFKNIPYLVCSEPGKLPDKDIEVIDEIKSEVNIFGYVNLGGNPLPPLSKLKNEIDNIKVHGWHGVFIDQFGYDFGETRERQNEIVEYAHNNRLICFVNCWFIDDAFSNKIDPIHNPKGIPTSLKENDWYLLESYYVSTLGYNGNSEDLIKKSLLAQKYKKELGVKIATLSYKRENASWEDSKQDINNSYFLSLLMEFDAWWFTDRLENDEFIHGHPIDLDIGNYLVQPLKRLNNKILVARTDKYYFILDNSAYPNIKLKAYDLIFKYALEKSYME